MQQKTQVTAEADKQEIMITRVFDLPLEKLFKAYIDPLIVAQWMGTNVVRLESKKYGSYKFETRDTTGKVVLKSSGVIHDFIPNQLIIRTFEMENTPFPVQLEFLAFEALAGNTSKLTMHVVYKSVADRDAILKLPFASGINMAHNKLEKTMNNLN